MYRNYYVLHLTRDRLTPFSPNNESNALNWVNSKTPEQTREQLEGWLPQERWGEVNVLWVGFGQETQQQKEKTLRKVLACSSPQEGLSLVQKVGLDVKKEAKRFGLEEEVKRAKK